MMDCVAYMKLMDHWPIHPNKRMTVKQKRIRTTFRYVDEQIIRDNRDYPEKKDN